jgi:hypothetical protein
MGLNGEHMNDSGGDRCQNSPVESGNLSGSSFSTIGCSGCMRMGYGSPFQRHICLSGADEDCLYGLKGLS